MNSFNVTAAAPAQTITNTGKKPSSGHPKAQKGTPSQYFHKNHLISYTVSFLIFGLASRKIKVGFFLICSDFPFIVQFCDLYVEINLQAVIMDVERVIRLRKTHMSPTYNNFQTFKDPVVLESAKMQYCYGPGGKEKYVDLLASNLTISVGHSHPMVLETAKTQMDKTPHLSSMYYTEPAALLAEKLVDTMKPRSDGEKWQVLFAVTGTEAVELAIHMARATTGSNDMLSLSNSYHGSYGTAHGITGPSENGGGCRFDSMPCTNNIYHLDAPIYDNASLDRVDGLIQQAEQTILEKCTTTTTTTTSSDANGDANADGDVTKPGTAGFIFETLQGYGGIHVLSNEYLQKMTKLVHQYGGLVIADEIQTGLGRMGETFWAYEMSSIEPDIVITAKGLGNGFPISAIICKESIFSKFNSNNKFIFSTYGANAVSCAVGCTVIDIIQNNHIQQSCLKLGSLLQKMLLSIQSIFPYPYCLHVRGCGLMVGIELNVNIAYQIQEYLKNKNYLVGLGGSQKNVLRIMPPMCITADDLRNFADVLVMAMSEITGVQVPVNYSPYTVATHIPVCASESESASTSASESESASVSESESESGNGGVFIKKNGDNSISTNTNLRIIVTEPLNE